MKNGFKLYFKTLFQTEILFILFNCSFNQNLFNLLGFIIKVFG